MDCLVGIVLFDPTYNNKSLSHIKIITTEHACYDNEPFARNGHMGENHPAGWQTTPRSKKN